MVSTNRASDDPPVTRILFYGLVALIAYLAYQVVQPFLVPIAWALVLAICLSPLQARLRPPGGRDVAAEPAHVVRFPEG